MLAFLGVVELRDLVTVSKHSIAPCSGLENVVEDCPVIFSDLVYASSMVEDGRIPLKLCHSRL